MLIWIIYLLSLLKIKHSKLFANKDFHPLPVHNEVGLTATQAYHLCLPTIGNKYKSYSNLLTFRIEMRDKYVIVVVIQALEIPKLFAIELYNGTVVSERFSIASR